MNKILVITIIGLLVFNIGIFVSNFSKEVKMEEPKYQGPVRPTDDEQHFRKTGETKPLEIEG